MTTRDDDFYNLQDEIRKLRRELDVLKNQNNFVPEFKFALREDLKDTNDLFLPKRATTHSVGFDVKACQKDRKDLILRAGRFFRIPLGFRAFCPDGWHYELHPRSSSFMKKYMHTLIGIIDTDFFHEVCLIGQYLPDVSSLSSDLVVKFGDPIAQIIPIKTKLINVNSISNDDYDNLCKNRTTNRTGGVGSTG